MKKKIKVLFFIDSFRIGGMHRQILYLVKHLDRDIFEPIMCTSRPDGGLRGEYEKTGCKLLDLGWEKALDPKTVHRLIKVLNSQKPDIVFISMAQNLFYFRLAQLFCRKKAVQIGSFRALTFWKGHLNKRNRFLDDLFSKWLYASSDTVVVNSDAMKDHYSKIINTNPQNPIITIYNGSDFNFPITKSESNVKQELNIQDDDILIVMVARLDPWKDFNTLISVASIVAEKDPRAKFAIIGDGELRNKLEYKISEDDLEGSVFLVGEKKDAYNYINAADISVLSTKGEGFSNSILESMYLGKPVIATDVGGNTEIIDKTGEFGILIPPKSPEFFAEEILKLMTDANRRRLIGEAAKKRIIQLCSIEKLVSSYTSLFCKKID